MLNNGQFKTTNYMVPSNGQTHAVTVQGQFSAVPYLIDWRQYAIDNEKFQPQGVFIDNTQGTVPLVIVILPINYTVTCPAGLTLQAQFPAPNGQTCTVTGDPNNTATVIFVDFPVLPSSNQATITNTPNVNISGVSAGVRMPTDGNPLAAGNTLPYRTQEYVPAGEFKTVTFVAGDLTHTVTPTTANQNLRKVYLTFTSNTSAAAAINLGITLALNGVTIGSRHLFLPAAAGTTLASPVIFEWDFDMLGLNAGAGGLVITLNTATQSGTIDVEAYFTPQ